MNGVFFMSTQKLFRETAFNGYNRDDVREYIKKQDERIRELETAAADAEAIRPIAVGFRPVMMPFTA